MLTKFEKQTLVLYDDESEQQRVVDISGDDTGIILALRDYGDKEMLNHNNSMNIRRESQVHIQLAFRRRLMLMIHDRGLHHESTIAPINLEHALMKSGVTPPEKIPIVIEQTITIKKYATPEAALLFFAQHKKLVSERWNGNVMVQVVGVGTEYHVRLTGFFGDSIDLTGF
jgi:hypothetical protein